MSMKFAETVMRIQASFLPIQRSYGPFQALHKKKHCSERYIKTEQKKDFKMAKLSQEQNLMNLLDVH